MRGLRAISWFGVLALMLGCTHRAVRSDPSAVAGSPPTVTRTEDASSASVTTRAPSHVQVERRYGAFSASATIGLRKTAQEVAASQHQKLAGSRAWLLLGRQRLSAEDWRGAMACARAGLEELGDHYAPPRVVDDTDLGLRVAQEQERRGHLQDAAMMMLDDLETRTRLYVLLHADEIEE